MDDSPENRIIRRRNVTKRQLRVVEDTPEVPAGEAPGHTRSIGRLIAQTALLADSALTRKRDRQADEAEPRRRVGRRLGWFL